MCNSFFENSRGLMILQNLQLRIRLATHQLQSLLRIIHLIRRRTQRTLKIFWQFKIVLSLSALKVRGRRAILLSPISDPVLQLILVAGKTDPERRWCYGWTRCESGRPNVSVLFMNIVFGADFQCALCCSTGHGHWTS